MSLKKLARRLHAPYLGTVVKGGVEGIQIKPPLLNRSLRRDFVRLGRRFGETGAFDPQIVARLKDEVYHPIPEHQAVYDRIYADYVTLHDYFGRGANDVMKRLKAFRVEAREG